MGSADIVPGVSGGTVALVLGIYTRLVTAISHFDSQLAQLLIERQWRASAAHVDLRFLVALGLGILGGVVCLARIVLHFLRFERPYTLAVFFGLILASSLIVAKMVRPQTSAQLWRSCCLALVAALFAFWLVGLEQFGYHDNLAYFFLCGAVAICAMILPGISGAYILWLLGAYETVAGIIHTLPHFQVSSRDLAILAVFAAGCSVGLISFSKLLRWLLDRAHMSTMAVLGGFMIGSLRLMWPFQVDLTPEIEKVKHKQFQPYLPQEFNAEVLTCITLAVVAAIAILALERWGSDKTEGQGTP